MLLAMRAVTICSVIVFLCRLQGQHAAEPADSSTQVPHVGEEEQERASRNHEVMNAPLRYLDDLERLRSAMEFAEHYYPLRGSSSYEWVDARERFRNLKLLVSLSSQQRATLAEAQRFKDEAGELKRAGHFEPAIPLINSALGMDFGILGREHLYYAEDLDFLGWLLVSLGRYREAEPLHRQALEITKTTLGEQHPAYATSLNNLAFVYDSMGRYAEAEPLLRQALQITKTTQGEQHPDYAISLNNLAFVYDSMGRYAEAELLLRQALQIMKTIRGEKHPDYARSLSNLAVVYDSMGRYAEAEPLHRQSLEIRRKALSERHLDYAVSLNNLAAVYKSMGRYGEAEPLLVQALEIRRKALGEQHPKYASSLNDLAALYDSMGQILEARSLYRQALELRKKALGEQHPDYANSLSNLASLYGSTGLYELAEPLFLQALEIERKVFGEQHPSTALTLLNLGMSMAIDGKSATAFPLLLRADELNWHIVTKHLPAMTEKQKQQFLQAHPFGVNLVTELELSNPHLSREQGFADVLLTKQLLFEAARQENGALQAVRAQAPRAWQALWREREDARQAFSRLALQSASEMSQTPGRELQPRQMNVSGLEGSRPARDTSAEQNRLSGEIEKLDQRLRESNPEYAALARLKAVTAADVKSTLPAGQALVEYVLFTPNKRWSQARYAAYVVPSAGEVQLVDLGAAQTIDDAVAEFRQLALGTKDGPLQTEAKVGKASSALRQLIWTPLEAHLSGVKRVYIAPDGQLSLLPFEALAQKSAYGKWKWRYLAEERELVYLNTGRDLARLALQPPSPALDKSTAVLVGDPDFNAQPEVVARAVAGLTVVTPKQLLLRAGRAAGQSTLSVSGDSGEAPRLEIPRAWEQVPALGQLLKQRQQQLKRLGGWSVTTMTGTAAIVPAVEAIRSPRLLQFATHGYILDKPHADPNRWDNPLLRSMLILAGANHKEQAGMVFYREGNTLLTGQQAQEKHLTEEQKQAGRIELPEGVLTAYQVTGVNLSGTELVNLTACETGLGEVTPDGVVGLRQAFLLAGARSLTMSMWEVPAEETTRQVRDFYERWLGGKPGLKAATRYAAFHAAQKTALQQARETYGSGHPYYWAGTIYAGDPGDLPALSTQPRTPLSKIAQ